VLGDWIVGDTSGAASFGTRNDIGVIWLTDASPIVIAVLSDRTEQNADYDDVLIAAAAAEAVDALR
jgi:beta-lactamase class A